MPVDLEALLRERRAATRTAALAADHASGVYVCDPTEQDIRRERKGGRPSIGVKPMTQAERDAKRVSRVEAAERKRNVLVLDMETDKFDNVTQAKIAPFLAVLYSPRFEEMGVECDPDYPDSIVIWENDHERLVTRIMDALNTLPQAYTVYGHNAGRYDYLFMVHAFRGLVKFKGNSIMSVMVGKHALRDSLHVVPESLSNIEKDDIDYNAMSKENRAASRDAIIRYCIKDCRVVFDLVSDFRENFGPKLTVGQASLAALNTDCPIKKFTTAWDGTIRPWYAGGRVQCLQGSDHYIGDYQLLDINSSYPNVMAKFLHPVGDFHDYQMIKSGNDIVENTCFLEIECDNNNALWGRTEEGETVFDIPHGVFKTTIHEYETALKYGLISNVKINYCVTCSDRTTFEKFVIPRYEKRIFLKQALRDLKKLGMVNSPEWFRLKRDDLFTKLILNSAYGKTGQDPSKFMEYFWTDPHEMPPPEWFESVDKLPEFKRKVHSRPLNQDPRYWIWDKPCPRFSYNNVGVAASVTGAARAVLLEALQWAIDPIYCDTDSIICRGFRPGAPLDVHETRLGAWDIEDRMTEVIVNGKKLYAVKHATPKDRTKRDLERGLVPEYTVKSKGAGHGTLSWQKMIDMLHGVSTLTTNPAPTLDRYGGQRYITRTIRATAKRRAP